MVLLRWFSVLKCKVQLPFSSALSSVYVLWYMCSTFFSLHTFTWYDFEVSVDSKMKYYKGGKELYIEAVLTVRLSDNITYLNLRLSLCSGFFTISFYCVIISLLTILKLKLYLKLYRLNMSSITRWNNFEFPALTSKHFSSFIYCSSIFKLAV